jgi:hypothetical protein
MYVIFKGERTESSETDSSDKDKLFAQIGQLKVELDFLKKSARKLGIPGSGMEAIKRNHEKISVRRRCDLLMVPRNSLYYAPIPKKPENVKTMNIMDHHLLKHPTEGVVSMVDMLKEMGYPVGPKRIRRLCRATDNTWIERFWRTLKENYIYLNPADGGLELFEGVLGHLTYYHQKKHQSLGMSPEKCYQESIRKNAA